MAILVFANGDMPELDWVRPLLDNATAVISANGGAVHLKALDHVPDLVVGDLDSLPDDVRSWLEDSKAPIIAYPSAKDETDLELALVHAANAYQGEILLIGVLGGRLDQTLANILLLAHPALQERRVVLLSQYERAWLVTAETEIIGDEGDTVSFIPLGGDTFVESTSGLQWPLHDEWLRFGQARGMSNVMTADTAAVTIRSGRLLCIHTQQAWDR
jgi:thiamine pyrophosphokinase